MKIEIEINEKDLKETIINHIAHEIYNEQFNSWNDESKSRRQAIIDKIDWKKSAPQISELIVKRFFQELVGKE